MAAEFVQLEDGTLRGPWRTPFNIAANAEGSIHNDETARELGLEGGWIAGSIHMEQFVPLFIQRFGLDWLETGGFSVYFKKATLSGEKVQASLSKIAPDKQAANLAMHDAAGAIVLEGEAWLGAGPTNTTLRSKLTRFEYSECGPLLSDIRPGHKVENVPSEISATRLAKDLPTVTEPIEAYQTGVLPPNLAIDSLRAVEPGLMPLPEGAVGLYGGIELQMIDGPILAGTNYLASGKVLAIGTTPRTEVLFYGSELFEAKALIAHLLMMTRIMGPPKD